LKTKPISEDTHDDQSKQTPVSEFHQPNNKLKTSYSSRRQRLYDDDESQDSDTTTRNMTTAGNDMAYVNTQGEKVSNKPNPRFKNYSGVFKNLIKGSNITTMYPICTMLITYDSTKAVTVTKKDDHEYYIKQYDLETYDMTFEEKVGGEPNDYIKLKEVE